MNSTYQGQEEAQVTSADVQLGPDLISDDRYVMLVCDCGLEFKEDEDTTHECKPMIIKVTPRFCGRCGCSTQHCICPKKNKPKPKQRQEPVTSQPEDDGEETTDMAIKWMQWKSRKGDMRAHAIDTATSKSTGKLRAINGALVPEHATTWDGKTPKDPFSVKILKSRAKAEAKPAKKRASKKK